jgi:hypothetical protein
MFMFGPWSPTINWLLALSKYKAEGRELEPMLIVFSMLPDGENS